MRKLNFIAATFIIAVLVATCKHEPLLPVGTSASPVISVNCNPDSIYFANTILPVMSSNCAMSGCHDPVAHKEGLVLNNYSGILRIVQPGNASASKLYRVITTSNADDVMPPPPHARLTSADITSIQKWINQGAKNNQCFADCDTTVFTYSGAVSPILNTYCKTCHNAYSLNGGIDLSNYASVKAIATSGRLMGSINHAPGYIAMPRGGNKLQDCNIIQIQKWIDSGMPNN